VPGCLTRGETRRNYASWNSRDLTLEQAGASAARLGDAARRSQPDQLTIDPRRSGGGRVIGR
jgi:hypothetical protein